jgi:hypothetical protein
MAEIKFQNINISLIKKNQKKNFFFFPASSTANPATGPIYFPNLLSTVLLQKLFFFSILLTSS